MEVSETPTAPKSAAKPAAIEKPPAPIEKPIAPVEKTGGANDVISRAAEMEKRAQASTPGWSLLGTLKKEYATAANTGKVITSPSIKEQQQQKIVDQKEWKKIAIALGLDPNKKYSDEEKANYREKYQKGGHGY